MKYAGAQHFLDVRALIQGSVRPVINYYPLKYPRGSHAENGLTATLRGSKMTNGENAEIRLSKPVLVQLLHEKCSTKNRKYTENTR